MKMFKTLCFSAFLLSSYTAQAITADEFAKLSPEDALEYSYKWHRTGKASVQVFPNSLEATLESGDKVSIAMTDQFLLSVAPYINQTHACTYHVPTGCQGEMIEQSLYLKVTDVNTGEVLQDRMVTTRPDGFIDLWMPRDSDYEFTFRKDNMVATEILSTKGDSRTCITTMRLESIE